MRELNTRSHSLVVVICCLFSHWFVAPYTHKLPVLTVLLRHVTWALWFQIHIAKVHISNGLGVYRSFTPLHSSPHFMRIWIAHCQHLYDNRCDTQISNWFVFSFGIGYENLWTMAAITCVIVHFEEDAFLFLFHFTPKPIYSWNWTEIQIVLCS